MMVLTILEARVAPEKAQRLHDAYSQGIQHLDAGIVQTFLLRNAKDPALWQIATLWKDREALDAMRRTGETPRGVVMFRAAGAEPVLSILEVAAHAEAGV